MMTVGVALVLLATGVLILELGPFWLGASFYMAGVLVALAAMVRIAYRANEITIMRNP